MRGVRDRILRHSEILAKRKSTKNQVISVLCGDLPFLIVTPEKPGFIVVTKWYSEYCNATLPVVHELHTALFQCSYPLFH